MKAKLVKESIKGLDTFDESKQFMIDHNDEIIEQWIEKMRIIFKKYIPWDKIDNKEEAIEECSNRWWFDIVEAGWNPRILDRIDYYSAPDSDSNALINAEESCINQAIEILGLPEEIIEL